MNVPIDSIADQSRYRPLRIWIPVILLALMAVARFVPGMVDDGPAMIWMISAFGPLLVGIILLLWWLLLSRARWTERVIGLLGLVAIFVVVVLLVHPSMQGPLVLVMTVPMGLAGFALGVIACSRMLSFRRTLVGLAVAFVGAGCSLLFQNFGTRGDFAFEMDWRWNPTPEQLFLAEREARGDAPGFDVNLEQADFDEPEWPGFRGPNRDGVQRGSKISSDWSTPPSEMWRIKIGPGWSSFAVAGDYLFTQEQRGELDAVVCYQASTGDEVWASTVESRFFEALGGLGPRATPTIASGKVYAMCAEGFLRCLKAENGSEVWSEDLRQVAKCSPPMWGFSSSPLVSDGIVAVHVGGDDEYGVIALDAESGELRWSAPAGKQSYSSFQSIQLGAKQYLALLTDKGAQLVDPANGQTALEYEWEHSGYRALQAQLVEGNRLIIPTGMGTGTRLIEIEEVDGQLRGKELWTSRDMKPDFNDVVVNGGFLYGFDSQVFACIRLQDGQRQWKGGRYGKGQVLLLADSGLLIVAAENGDLVLLRENPDEHEELARIKALSGKTWNHPVVVGDRLFLRNAEEAVCFQLPTATID
ncbi:MAG: PQQ-binding-like beta-propeller repeat protein [Planctomycetales bacterium]|nr:PQQ-binding-like beta-propeller repeat protein [Planctomycetales bacterium]